jgi:uncharacterized protein YndB with AHSA1/START domain
MVLKMTAEKGGRELAQTAVFDAPRDLVYRAHTEPALLQRWWGPRELSTTVEKYELRPGGIWRIIQRDPQGKEYAFHGVFHEVTPGQRIIQTFEYEGMPGRVALQTINFEEKSGKTMANTMMVFQTPEDRDGMIETGAERGAQEGLERLLDLLDELQAGT